MSAALCQGGLHVSLMGRDGDGRRVLPLDSRFLVLLVLIMIWKCTCWHSKRLVFLFLVFSYYWDTVAELCSMLFTAGKSRTFSGVANSPYNLLVAFAMCSCRVTR